MKIFLYIFGGMMVLALIGAVVDDDDIKNTATKKELPSGNSVNPPPLPRLNGETRNEYLMRAARTLAVVFPLPENVKCHGNSLFGNESNPSACRINGKGRDGLWRETNYRGDANRPYDYNKISFHTGFYKNGEKHGFWEEDNPAGKILAVGWLDARVATGFYYNGKKHGERVTQYGNGRVSTSYYINGEFQE